MDQESEIDIMPYSFIEGVTVASLMVVNHAADKLYIVGFNPEEGGWERVDAWNRDEWSQEEMEETFFEWSDRVHDEETTKTERLNIDP